MTDCNRVSLHFSSLGSRSVVADFQGGRLTTDGGALLFREVAERTGVLRDLAAVIPDPRNPELIVHDQQTMLTQRVIAIALGYEDLNDHKTLRSDPVLQLTATKAPDPEKSLASAPTLCRLENRVNRTGNGEPVAVLRFLDMAVDVSAYPVNEKRALTNSVRTLQEWRRRESNSQPPACKAGALPIELRPREIYYTSNKSLCKPETIISVEVMVPGRPECSWTCRMNDFEQETGCFA